MKILLATAFVLVALLVWTRLNKSSASKLTDAFLDAVQRHQPLEVARLFCREAVLWGTVSKIRREGADIERYFEYFANLPNIRVVSKDYAVAAIEDDVEINNALVTWTWDGLEKPVQARMTFVVKDQCIFELHSSALPEKNEKLHKISQKF